MRKQQWQAGAFILLAIVLVAAGNVQAGDKPQAGTAATTSPIMLAPDTVKWDKCPAAVPPGAQCAVIEGDLTTANQLFAFRIKMPDNYRIAPHFHPGDEHVVVLSGVLNMGMGEKFDTSAGHAMSAGSFMVMPKGERHFAWTNGETIIQVYAIGPWGLTYVNPEDDPRKNLPSE
ncbi:MAG: DUF4437 domain-containing protein [Acidobacteria bacterium]|nr:MAG: DUF4437 domain-containing protein [Acidobacteriota bacterium]